MCYQKNVFLLLRPLFKIAFSKYFQPHIKDQTSLFSAKLLKWVYPSPQLARGIEIMVTALYSMKQEHEQCLQ